MSGKVRDRHRPQQIVEMLQEEGRLLNADGVLARANEAMLQLSLRAQQQTTELEQ